VRPVWSLASTSGATSPTLSIGPPPNQSVFTKRSLPARDTAGSYSAVIPSVCEGPGLGWAVPHDDRHLPRPSLLVPLSCGTTQPHPGPSHTLGMTGFWSAPHVGVLM